MHLDYNELIFLSKNFINSIEINIPILGLLFLIYITSYSIIESTYLKISELPFLKPKKSFFSFFNYLVQSFSICIIIFIIITYKLLVYYSYFFFFVFIFCLILKIFRIDLLTYTFLDPLLRIIMWPSEKYKKLYLFAWKWVWHTKFETFFDSIDSLLFFIVESFSSFSRWLYFLSIWPIITFNEYCSVINTNSYGENLFLIFKYFILFNFIFIKNFPLFNIYLVVLGFSYIRFSDNPLYCYIFICKKSSYSPYN